MKSFSLKKKKNTLRKQAKLEADCNMVILSIGFCLYIEAYLSGCGIQLATISRLMRKALHKF